MRAWTLGLSVVVLSSALTMSARAQSAQDKAAAEALFIDGRAAMESGNFAVACPKFATSEQLDPAIGTALFLGECYERTNKIASAWAMFHEAQDLAQKRGDKRADIAKQRADRLEPSKLTITLGAGANLSGLQVERDGVVISSTLLGVAIPTDGGAHTIRASAPGKKSVEQTIQLDGQKGAATVTIPKLEDLGTSSPVVTPTPNPTPSPTPTPTVSPTPTPSPVPQPPTASDGSGQRIAGIAVMGAGVVGVVLGSAFGVMAGSDWHASNTDGKCDANSTKCFDPSGPGLRSSAQSEALISTVGFVLGGAALVGGAIVLFTAPKSREAKTGWTLSPTLGGMLVRGTF